MNRRRVFNKLGKIFMVMTMILSMCFSAGNTKVNAWDGNVPHEFTRVKNIKYPKWWGRKIASLKQWSTYSCKYNGQWSYCLESSKKHHRQETIRLQLLKIIQWLESCYIMDLEDQPHGMFLGQIMI